jgi:hypothetical protein
MIIEAAARHTPAAGDGSAPRVFGSKQSTTGCNDRVRREPLPDRGTYIVTEHKSGIASLAPHLRTRFVGHRTYQQPQDQLARAPTVGVDRTDDNVAAVERQHVGIGPVVEKCLERIPTMLSDANDQHLVIIAQRLLQKGASDAAV